MTGQAMRGRAATVARGGLATLVLYLVLIQPNHPGAMTPGAFRLFPLELPALILLMLALSGLRVARWTALALAATLTLIAVLKAADLAMFTAFGRGFNILADPGLAVAGTRLLAGSVGLPLAALAIAALAVAVAAGFLMLVRALGFWAALPVPGRARAAAGVGAAAALALCVAEIGQAMRVWSLPAAPPGAAFTARIGVERVIQVRRTRAEILAFRAAAAKDPFAQRAGLLAALEGRDVQVIFVESYGRASIDNPLYAPTHTATLARAEAALVRSGLAARTLYLSAPIRGGQSWLAHATFASGLSVGNHTRNAALLASPRRTLWQVARDAGYRTAAVMPAITMPWPEAARLGFDIVLDRDAMGYRGQPFNWVTMPDQFTLARFHDRLPPDPRPLFAQIALISSHAPWVPVPDLLPWEAIGDGTEFDAMASRGDPPEVVWRDNDRVRDQYRQSLDYALDATLGFVARQGAARGGDAPLVLVLGDHPAAGFVAQTGGADVPLHLIGPPGVLAAFDAWAATPGLLPDTATPSWPMQAFRDRFLEALSPPSDPAAAAVPATAEDRT